MGTDGSAKYNVVTYSWWVISTPMEKISADIKGGDLLPPMAQYLDPYSKPPEAAAPFAGLSYITPMIPQHHSRYRLYPIPSNPHQ
jgi:hypothetical protein